MHSYIKIHHFEPRADYRPIKKLIPLIDQTMNEQRVSLHLNTEEMDDFREGIVRCLEVYYKLVGINEEVIAGKGMVQPQGILPRYTESLIKYFQKLEYAVPANEEITTLEYSGVDTIKIRYKYTNSVIKKLVKLGLKDPEIFREPLRIFLKGGALHDLIGMLFVCSYPYEREWAARALYSFFYFPHRTDDHLLYGFYTVEKKSGYRALHCDHTLFDPRFDSSFLHQDDSLPDNPETIFNLLRDDDDAIDVLQKLKNYFNIEIQLHTTFENLWSTMEHANSYDIQAKGLGRSSKITAQWKLLSETMKNIEEQFEQLQVETEQIHFETQHHEGYVPVREFLDLIGSDTYPIHNTTSKKVEKLEELLVSHEISRQDYVCQLQSEIASIDAFSLKLSDPSAQTIFRMQSAFIYYGLANQSEFFNTYDIRQFVKESLKRYSEISTYLSSNTGVFKGDLLNVVTIFRYLYLGQKYGMGLFDPPIEFFAEEDNPVASHAGMLLFFETGISLLNSLNREDKETFIRDGTSYIKIIYHYDLMAREWELFIGKRESPRNTRIAKEIARFRSIYITPALLDQFNRLLKSNKIKNIGFVVKFYTTLVWHAFLDPIDALKQIIKYSAYEKIKASELFHYELSAYRSLITQKDKSYDHSRFNHLKDYHIKNMIRLLFRIKRRESTYKFYECRLYFEQLTQNRFKIDHFGDSILQGDNQL